MIEDDVVALGQERLDQVGKRERQHVEGVTTGATVEVDDRILGATGPLEHRDLQHHGVRRVGVTPILGHRQGVTGRFD